MAHNGSSDAQAASLDAQMNGADDGVPAASDNFLQAELSPASQDDPSYQVPSGRPKALTLPVSPVVVPVYPQNESTLGSPSPGFWDPRRRTQSDSNLRAEHHAASPLKPAAVPYLASPAHSESALRINGEKEGAGPLLPISVKTTGFMDNLLSGISDFAKAKSPKGAMQTVEVVYPTPGPLFMDLFSRDDGTGAKVKGFRRKPDGSMADAEASGRIFPNDELVLINKVSVAKMEFADIITTAKEATFPLTLTFHCFQSNREEHDKQHRQQQQTHSPERKYSSSPLPPTSPSSNWSSKLGKMSRSGSFDQKSSGSLNGGGVPRSPSTTSTTSEKNTGKFGVSLDKVRNTGSDGVKSLFRIMGNKSSRPEEDKSVVKGWMENLAIKPHNSSSGGRRRKTPSNAKPEDVLHSTPLVAVTTGGRFVGVLDEDVHEFALTWYRTFPPDNDIQLIKHVNRCPYFPSVDDVGAVLTLQCASLRFPQFKRVVEMPQPLVLDPAVGNMVDVLLEAGAGSFSATLASNEHDSFQIKISADCVALVKISEDEDEGGVVVKAEYSPFLQILLHPADQLRFTLKVQEFGGFLGNREGDICDLKNRQVQFGSLSCFFLVAQNRQHRDILTLLIRKFRARVLTRDQEGQAQSDERSLFMDPAFAADTSTAPSLAGVVSSSFGALSPSNHSGATASTAGSPTTATTPSSQAVVSPEARKTGVGRLQSEGSMSSVRFSDLVGLEPDCSEGNGPDSNPTTPAATPPKAALKASKNGFGGLSANSIAASDGFVEGRIAAQDKEIAMLRNKMASLSSLLKSTEQEKKLLEASLEVKDNRIELQQLKIRQLEKFPGQCNTQAREIQSLRTKLEAEERKYAMCRDELQQALSTASVVQEQGVQTEDQFLDGVTSTDSVGLSSSGFQRDVWSGNVATVSANDLQQQIKVQQVQIARLQEEQVALVAERNTLRAKSNELSNELRRIVRASKDLSLNTIGEQLEERSALETELALVKADAKRKTDEMDELKSVVNGLSDKEKGARGLAAQNLELQRTIRQLTDSLNESKDQMDTVKKINNALASRLHRLQPDTRARRVDLPPTSTPAEHSSDDGESDDDDDEEEDEELQDGLAAFRRSLVGK